MSVPGGGPGTWAAVVGIGTCCASAFPANITKAAPAPSNGMNERRSISPDQELAWRGCVDMARLPFQRFGEAPSNSVFGLCDFGMCLLKLCEGAADTVCKMDVPVR